jgi:hypothetical protein
MGTNLYRLYVYHLKHFFLYNFQDKNTRKTFKCLLGTDHLTCRRGLWFFVSFRKCFSDNTRVRIFIFLSRKARNFIPEFIIRLYDKNSKSDYFFFLHQNQNIFSATLGIRIFF